MTRARLYGVFVGDHPTQRYQPISDGWPDRNHWAMTRNKARAVKWAKVHGGTVRAMALPYDNGAWDAATFQMCSVEIASFTRAVRD